MGKANRGVMDMMVTLFELPKTIKMLRNMRSTLDRIERIGMAYKTAQRERLLRESSKLYLELRYGWRQLYFDATNLWELMCTFVKQMRKSYTSGNSRSGQWLESYDSEITLGTGGFKLRTSGQIQLRAGVSVDANLTDKWYKKLYQLMGGFNPIGVAYELFKLSWVLDWWHNFGALISALGKDPACFIRAWHTIEMPEQGELNIVQIWDAEISHTDIRDAIGNFDLPWVTIDDWGDLCPYSGYMIKQLFNDDEMVITIPLRNMRCSVYHRIPRDPTRFPLVVPKGTTIRTVGQVADMLALFTKSKPRGL